MTNTIRAIFANGVFRPTEPVDLPDPCQVEFELRVVNPSPSKPTLDDVHAVLGQRFHSGEADVAARHDMNQP